MNQPMPVQHVAIPQPGGPLPVTVRADLTGPDLEVVGGQLEDDIRAFRRSRPRTIPDLRQGGPARDAAISAAHSTLEDHYGHVNHRDAAVKVLDNAIAAATD